MKTIVYTFLFIGLAFSANSQASIKIIDLINDAQDLHEEVINLEDRLYQCIAGTGELKFMNYSEVFDYQTVFRDHVYFNSPKSWTHKSNQIPTISVTFDQRDGKLIKIRFSNIDEAELSHGEYLNGFIIAEFNRRTYSFDEWGNRPVTSSARIKDPTR